MRQVPDEFALRRAWRAGHPSTGGRSFPDLVAQERLLSSARVDPGYGSCDEYRDAAERAGDRARELAEALADAVERGDPVARDTVDAAADRAAAACDRYAAAVDRHQAAQNLRRTSRDVLTGALSRDIGMDRLRAELDRSARDQAPLVVAFVDVDGLKHVNDTQGHLAGDAVLRALGAALRFSLRAYDVVVRYGGDEFVCALPGAALTDGALRLGQVQQMLSVLQPGCSVSVGLAELRADESLTSLLSRADEALYAGRRARLVAAVTPPEAAPGPAS